MQKISGIVIKGKEKGGNFGFPTANIKLSQKIGSGVYAGSVAFDGKSYKAAIFINIQGDTLEAHILDFSGDLYGKKIEVEIGQKIREIINFKNTGELVEKIKEDIIAIKKL